MLILGIDDAGRGPLIGPMILAGALVESSDEPMLKKQGVNDSKQVTHPRRVELAKLIEKVAKDFFVVKSDPDEIDEAVGSGMNLNTLEAAKAAMIINRINDKKSKIKVIVDCPSVNTVAWRNKLLEFIEYKDNLDFVCEHKADANHVSVSAASILAKVERENEVEKIKKKYGNIGSGYPSDPYTKKFLEEKGREFEDSGIFRKSWATWKSMYPQKNQSKLEL